MTAPLRLGTRGSRLAVAQSRQVARALEAATGRPVELVRVVTHGDVNRASLATIGGVGVFATALREALAAGEIDLVVHSCKDLPTAAETRLEIAAMPRRADVRDVLVTRAGQTPATLPAGARIGTGSTRRQAQVRRLRPDARVVDIRGNVDSRLARLDADLDGVVLAAAGLTRLDPAADVTGGSLLATPLGRADLTVHPLAADAWVPAPAQGVLAVETRRDEAALVDVLDDPATRLAATLERAVLAGLGSGCAAPVGVHATVAADGAVLVRARVYDVVDEVEAPGPQPGDVALDVTLDDVPAYADAARITAWATAAGEGIARRLVAAGADRVIAAAEVLAERAADATAPLDGPAPQDGPATLHGPVAPHGSTAGRPAVPAPAVGDHPDATDVSGESRR